MQSKNSHIGSIAFLVPFHSGIEFAKKTFESVVNQTDPRWSLIILIDGNMNYELLEYVEKISDKRITIFATEKHLGIYGMFKLSLEKVNSEYFCLLGADDVLSNDYVKVIQEKIRLHRNADAFIPKVSVIDEFDKIHNPLADKVKSLISRMHNSIVINNRTFPISLAIGDWIYFPSVCWKSSTVKKIGFGPRREIALDLYLLFAMSMHNCEFISVKENIFYYRRHTKSASSTAISSGVRFYEERSLLNYFSWQFLKQRRILTGMFCLLRLSVRLHALIYLLRTPKAILVNPQVWKTIFL